MWINKWQTDGISHMSPAPILLIIEQNGKEPIQCVIYLITDIIAVITASAVVTAVVAAVVAAVGVRSYPLLNIAGMQ